MIIITGNGKGSKDSRTKIMEVFGQIQERGFLRNRFEYDGINPVQGDITVGKDIIIRLYEATDSVVDGVIRVPHTLTQGQIIALNQLVNNISL